MAMTEGSLWVFFVLNILVMIKKPAFLSLTAIVVAFYLLHNTLTIKRS